MTIKELPYTAEPTKENQFNFVITLNVGYKITGFYTIIEAYRLEIILRASGMPFTLYYNEIEGVSREIKHIKSL